MKKTGPISAKPRLTSAAKHLKAIKRCIAVSSMHVPDSMCPTKTRSSFCIL